MIKKIRCYGAKNNIEYLSIYDLCMTFRGLWRNVLYIKVTTNIFHSMVEIYLENIPIPVYFEILKKETFKKEFNAMLTNKNLFIFAKLT